MRKYLQVALGILAAIGGFVDIGDLVFATQAGAKFRYGLIWAVVVGVIGAAVYSEMAGRVAAVAGRPVMTVVRQRMGFSWGLVAVTAGTLVSLLTLAAEIGGVGVVLQLLFDAGYSLFVIVGAVGLLLMVWLLPFEWIERVLGYGGLLLVVFIVAAVNLHPDWDAVAKGFVPQFKLSAVYAYFVVGVIAAGLMPYEVYFYSSGAVEEGWTKKDLVLNRLNSVIGYGLGGVLAIAILVTSAQVFFSTGVEPQFLGTTALAAELSLGQAGLLLALGGMLFAVAGASVDTAFASAYNVCQFLGWEWGKYRSPKGAARFTLLWIAFFGFGALFILTGIDPVQVTEYAVVFSVVAMPLTYFPIVLMARDRTFMGDHANGRFASSVGWLYLGIICIVALVAIPLLLATNAGG